MTRYDIVSIGNASQDVFVEISPEYAKKELCFSLGQKIEIEGVHYFTGGGATNTAVAFARMGLSTGIISAIGNDSAGKAVESELRREKVSASLLMKSKTATAYSVILTGFGKDRVILVYRGATASLDPAKINHEKIDSKWIHVSSLHKAPKAMEKICVSAKKKGIMVSINPGKHELEGGMNGLAKTLENCDILFLNETEAMSLTKSADIERNLAAIYSRCKEGIIVITAGSHGAYAFDGKTVYYKGILPVDVVDATGAGDAFCSGFLGAIASGRGIDEAMNWGTAQANSVVTTIGTKNILLSKNGIKKFLSRFRGGFDVEKKEA